MLKICISLLLLTSVLTAETPIKLQSAHTQDSFHVTFSIAPDQLIHFYSKKIVSSPNHVLTISTYDDKVWFDPPLDPSHILLNQLHQGRYLVEYYAPSQSNDNNKHFHYAEVEVQGKTTGYLLPSFTRSTRALKVERLFRCSNTLISASWCNESAWLKVFSKGELWTVQQAEQNIDDGFRSSQRGIDYGEVIDHKPVHPVQLNLGDRHHCIITQQTPGSSLQFDWKRKDTYQLEEVLTIIGNSLPVHRKLENQPQAQQL